MTSETNERRCQIISIGFNQMVAIMRGDVVLTSLPEDATLTSAHYNFMRQSIDVIVEHRSFDPVPHGDIIPSMMTCGVRRVERVVVVESSQLEPEVLLPAMKEQSQKGALVIVEWRDEVKTANE